MTSLLHPPIWQGVQAGLADIFVQGWPADKVIQRALKNNKKWGGRDRRLYAECVYDIVRWWRRLLHVAGVAWPKDDKWVSSDPNSYAKATAVWCLLNDVGLGKNLPDFAFKEKETLQRWNDPGLTRAVRESLPDWLEGWAAGQLAERWTALATTLNTVAPVYLRANQLKTTPQELVTRLAQDKIEAEAIEDDALKLKQRQNVFLTSAFKGGLFEVQDLNSQKVALALAPEAGMRVVDACAGAGGKSLHMAALMRNKGKIIALDVAAKKLDQLRDRATRSGATIIEARPITSSKIVKRLKDSADRLLLDVPCSGLGVIRRNPDAKWKLSLEEVARVKQLQSEILNSYSEICRVGGIMVYATCSIMPSENEDQIGAFLSGNETCWQLIEQKTFWPEPNGPDGFFMARLKRLS